MTLDDVRYAIDMEVEDYDAPQEADREDYRQDCVAAVVRRWRRVENHADPEWLVRRLCRDVAARRSARPRLVYLPSYRGAVGRGY